VIRYILLNDLDFSELKILPHYREWLVDWLKHIEEDTENGIVSSSMCLQGLLSELTIYNRCKTDWSEILRAYLKNNEGKPLAYSQAFGEKLYRFNQWEQSPVHAVHTHWWIEKLNRANREDLSIYSNLIEQFIQPSGWIYNPAVSNTNTRTRMRMELMMSVAMGLEILSYQGLSEDRKRVFEGLLSSVPITGYLSAEYFRFKALDILDMLSLAPSDVSEVITTCQAGEGFCDFSITSKVDDYMGTAKRVSRDKPLHSAISSLHANYIATRCSSDVEDMVNSRLRAFSRHLSSKPFDIPAFRMRDVDVPFGTDLSPFEVIGASYIVSNWGN